MTMKPLAAALLIAALPGFFMSAAAATLTVHVANIDPKGGTLRVSLYDEFAWSAPEDEPQMSGNVPAVAPETTVVFKDVKPGVYGVKCYQDANNNGKFDQNFIGLPLERFGFSHDAKPFLTQPGFNRTRFTVKDGDNDIVFRLQ
jgi:uncharacterized protein (DUF2141 family)